MVQATLPEKGDPMPQMIKILFTLSIAFAFSITVVAKDADPKKNKDPRKFTSERVFDLEYADAPQVSPDGKTIVYLRRSMNKFTDRVVGNLWQIDVSSGRHRPLIVDQGSVSSVRWSPSGDRILYLTSRQGKPSLQVRYMASGQSFSLAQFEHGPSAPAWSNDGKQIAFSMLVAEKKASFATAPKPPEDAEWAKPVNVYDDLVFRFNGAGYLDKGVEHVFTISAEGGTPRQITDGENGTPRTRPNRIRVVSGQSR